VFGFASWPLSAEPLTQAEQGAENAGADAGDAQSDPPSTDNGEVLATRIVASSGAKLLDQEAVAMIARAGPFPPIPPEFKRTSMTFTVPVRFQR
jgi:protein TonB